MTLHGLTIGYALLFAFAVAAEAAVTLYFRK